ncbi:MAG TPA: GNAT family N-acetyltransferase [Verrucomicrobiae bacterium]|nr:GNAT family N-acetyltransferase [Verrucomicrobiae bacterium]
MASQQRVRDDRLIVCEVEKRGTEASGNGEVAVLNPLEGSCWDEAIGVVGGGGFFHGSRWALVLQESYGYRPYYICCEQGGRTTGLLPLMEVDSWVTGRRGVSLPFTDECQPLAVNSASFQLLLQKALARGNEHRWKYLELRGGREFLPEEQASQRFYGHVVDLTPGEEKLFASLRPSVRRAIRKAKGRGLEVEISQELEAVQQFYALQCKTRRKHGLPPQPFQFFRKLHEHILSKGCGIVVLARLGAKIVAANVYLHKGQEALYKFGASEPAYQEMRGNDLVMWEGIKYYAWKGFRSLHLGRTSVANEGLRRFKLGWGAREGSIEYFRYDLRLQGFVTGRDEAFGWYNRFFSVLPLGLSRLFGGLLYRHVG